MFGGRRGRLATAGLAGAAIGGFGAHRAFAGGWNGGGWDRGGWGGRGWDRGWGWGGWGRGWGWDDWDRDDGWNAALAGLVLGLTVGYPYWDPWYFGGYWYGGYWGPDYAYWGPDYWGPDYAGYWDEPYYAAWEPYGYGYGYGYGWPRYRRPITRVSYEYAEPAVYPLAAAYDFPVTCGGAHYVWDDIIGAYVLRPYGFLC